MLCDRCVLGGRCGSFSPGGLCALERKAYDCAVSELMAQYGLKGLADEILVGRVAMYMIRIARAEVYEANVGVSDASSVWGRYIADLDDTLRVLLRDLALTRAERKKLEKGDMLVDVDRLLNDLARRPKVKRRALRLIRRRSPLVLVRRDWADYRRRLISGGHGGHHARRGKNP